MRRSLSFGFTASFNALLILQWLLAFHLFTSGEAYPIAQRNSTAIYPRQPTANPICDIGIPGKTGTKKLRMLGGQDFIAFPNCANNRGFFFDIRNSRVRANTNIARDGRMTALTSRPRGNVNCDHKVDINILLRAIEQPGGLCEQLNAQGFSPQDIDSELESLRAIINSPNNLVFITDEVERNQKNKVNEAFRNGGFVNRAGLTLTPSIQGLAGMDYLDRITAESRNTADELDREINAILGGPPSAQARTVRQIWDDFLDMGRDSKAKTVVRARRELQIAQQQAQQAAARARQCGRRPPPTKRSGVLYARQELGRAPTNTAAAPSCPAPGQQTKRVVPADQVQERKRETPPAIATNKNALTANPPGPRRAVSRPPNRQKRVPGQAAPRPSSSGRTKPSRKPRAVPKPAGRPAGRPRGRRGRR